MLVYASAVGASAVAGLLVARSQSGFSLPLLAVIGLAWLTVLLSVPPTVLFLGWLALAPIFADSAQASAVGRAGIWAIYIAPAVLLGGITVLRLRRGAIVSFVEFLPAAFVAYVLVSIAVTSDAFQINPLGTFRVLFLMVALGPLVYYFLTIGPGADIPREKLLITLMAGAALQGVLAVVDAATHWNLWSYTVWQGSSGARAVSTLANPGILGAFLGVGITLALAVLTWRGPRSYRRLAVITVLVCVPGLLVTLTRGPILAAVIGAVLLLVFGHKRLMGAAVIASAVIVLVALWPTLHTSELYQGRARQANTIQSRVGLQAWSLDLAGQKPVFGWGYGSFDRVKNTAELDSIEGIPVRYLLETTSHNSYLTILVELGGLGILLYALPFLILGGRALFRARDPTPDSWIIAGSVAALVVLVLAASTLDFRFFSFAQMLPWLFLAILRGAGTIEPASTQST